MQVWRPGYEQDQVKEKRDKIDSPNGIKADLPSNPPTPIHLRLQPLDPPGTTACSLTNPSQSRTSHNSHLGCSGDHRAEGMGRGSSDGGSGIGRILRVVGRNACKWPWPWTEHDFAHCHCCCACSGYGLLSSSSLLPFLASVDSLCLTFWKHT